MIFYMGELITVQNRPEEGEVATAKNRRRIRYIPKIWVGPPPKRFEQTLLRVKKGPVGTDAAAVIVTHEGETYSIPREDAGRSMHVLSMVTQIFAQHQSSKELATTPTVRIIGD